VNSVMIMNANVTEKNAVAINGLCLYSGSSKKYIKIEVIYLYYEKLEIHIERR